MLSRISKYISIPVAALGLVVILSSWPPAWADIQHDINGKDVEHTHSAQLAKHSEETFTQAAQIKLLIGIVVALLGGNMWWTRRYMTQQDNKEDKRDYKDTQRDKAIKGISRQIDTLQGEHDMAMQIRGCASDPTILETSVRDAVKVALQPLFDFHLHGRMADRENFKDDKDA